MKKITFFRFIVFLALLFSTMVGYSQTIEIMNPNVTYSSIGNTTSCNSNEVIIEKVFLGDASGNPITNCPVTGDVFIYIKLSKASTKYALYTEFKLFIDGIQYKIDGTTATNEFIQVKQALSNPNGTNQLSTTTNYQVAKIPYNCGASFELKEIYISWGPNASTKPDDDQDGPKCDSGVPNITVDGPLEVDFTYTRNCNAITVTSDVTGGKIYEVGGLIPIQNPYALTINYGDGTGNFTISPNPDLYNDSTQAFIDYTFPAHSYPVNNTANPIVYTITLTATDTATPTAASNTKTYTVTIYPQLAGLTLTPSPTSCNGSLGSITASGVTGGNGSYTYSINGGTNYQASATFNNLTNGLYTIIAKDSNGCTISNSTSVVVTTAPTASITGVLSACLSTTLTANTNASSPTYIWYKDNVIINGQTASTLVVNTNGDYKVKITNGLTSCETTSAVSTVSVEDKIKPVITCPANIAVNADAAMCAAAVTIVNPTATDNCSTTFTFTGVRSDALALSANYPVGVTTITWTATDAAGNVSLSCNQTVTVTDNEKPVITCPANIAVNADAAMCAAAVTIVNPTATDNCSTTFTFIGVRSDALALSANYPVGVTTITWTATDAAGNVSLSCNQTVTVTDNEKPVITCPANIAVNADAAMCAAAVTIVNPTATDNCSTTFTFTGVRSDALALSANYPVGVTTITWTATDAAGNVSLSCEQTVTVTDNEKPVITCPANIAVNADAAMCAAAVTIVNPTATDNCSTTFTFTGVRSDALALSANYPVGVTTITWTATDAAGNVSLSCNQTVTVTDNEKPVITCPANIAVNADAAMCAAAVTIVNPTATDNCSTTFTFIGVRSDALALSANYPVGVTTITWTATDAAGNVSLSCNQTVTVTDNEKPVITCPANIAVNADAAMCAAAVTIVNPTATDNCSTTFTFTGVRSDALALSANYPVGVTTITWTATDAAGNVSLSCEQTVTVTDNEKPVITCPANIAVNADAAMCAAAVTIVNPTATDNCSTTFTFTGVRSDALALSANYPVGVTTITWTATDAAGNVSLSCEQTVTVTDNEKPVITCPANIAVNADAAMCAAAVTIVNPTATDNCSTTFTFTGVRSDALALSANYPVGVTTITWTATDAAGNVSLSCEQTVTVTDNEKPVITCPANIAVNADAAMCAAAVTIVNPTATDNCSTTFTFTGVRSDALALSANYPVGVTTITWTATDAAGNVSLSCNQTVTVTDNEKPVITCPANIAVNADAAMCAAAVTIVNPTATDNCSTTFTFTGVRSDALALSANYPVGVTTITWTATDAAGNVSLSCEQTVTVTDNEKPVITCPANIAVNADAAMCAAAVTIVNPTATDNCSTTFTFTGVRSDALALSANYPVGVTTITWTATDAAGNVSLSCNQTVTVTDNEKPVITCPANIAVNADAAMCAAAVTIVNPTATDNCSTTFTFIGVRSDALALSANYPVGVTTITWTATDAAGNVSLSCNQTVTVTDNEKPVITCPANIAVNADAAMCAAAVTIVNPTATDNCSTTFTFTGVRSDALALSANYPVGVTTITWTATDAAGNVSLSCNQTVTVTDNEKPVITCPANIAVNADAAMCAAAVTIVNPTATDNCSTTFTFTGVRSDALALSANYPVGVTTITWTATDAAGNVSLSCNQTVTVTDNEKPVITCPANIAVNADAAMCAAAVTIVNPTATDNCSTTFTFTGVRSDALALSANYPVGVTTITWTATDAAGNVSLSCNQTVTVTDNEKPVITCPANIAVNADAAMCAAAVTIVNPTATDNCSTTFTFTGVRSDALALSANYPVGVTTITWTATDAAGNVSLSCNQTVTVTDNIKPVIATLPTPSTIYCPDLPVFVTPTATDNCTVISLTSVDVRINGSCAGTYSVTRTWTATDAGGNITTASQTINVEDNTAPAPITAFQTVINTTCAEVPVKPELIFADSCSEIAPIVVYSENIINNSSTSYSIIRKWNVKDACNNIADYIQTVNVAIITNVTTITVPEFINSINGTPVDLTTYLPQDAPSNGTWVDVNNSGLLNGSILNPNNAATGDYTFQYNIETETCPISYVINLKIDQSFVLGCGTIVVHNAFTPNGDAFNEKFVIDNIDDTICYPENSVEIYNRWGILVYEAKGYNNEEVSFKGFSEGRVTVDKSAGLPAGTYFYILNYTAVGLQGEVIPNRKQGYLYLTR